MSAVRKGGAFVALEADDGRRHVLGYVRIQNSGLTESSVLTFTNFIPSGRRFALLISAERLIDKEETDDRMLVGVGMRF
ncbi:MAG: hypothetical protein ACM3O7_12040 [Acidobacteriota bacterium]